MPRVIDPADGRDNRMQTGGAQGETNTGNWWFVNPIQSMGNGILSDAN